MDTLAGSIRPKALAQRQTGKRVTAALALSDILGPQAVVGRLEASNKKSLIQDMARHAAASLGIEEHHIFDVLWERERLGTTGVGHGLAIPHGKIDGLTKVCGFFARATTPVSFDAVDDKPVDLIFMLLAPEGAGADHLHALATVSRLLRDTKLCEALRKAKDNDAVLKLLLTTSAEAA